MSAGTDTNEPPPAAAFMTPATSPAKKTRSTLSIRDSLGSARRHYPHPPTGRAENDLQNPIGTAGGFARAGRRRDGPPILSDELPDGLGGGRQDGDRPIGLVADEGVRVDPQVVIDGREHIL